MKEFKIKIGFIVVNLLLSIIVGTLLPSIVKISLGEQIIISLTFFLAISFIEFLYFYNLSLQYIKAEYKLWEIQNEGEEELYNIFVNFHEIVKSAKMEKDVFVAHFIRQFKNLSQVIADAAKKEELYIRADYFLNSENVINAFPNYNEAFWNFTWQINNAEEELFKEEAWLLFFEMTAKLVQERKMKSIKGIIILSELSFIQHPRIEKLLAFFKTNRSISCKIITHSRFTNILNQNSFTITDDFGIYGSRLLYIEKYLDSEAAGLFVKKKHTIESYSSLFNLLWNSDSMTTPNPSKETTKVEVSSLINFDKNLS